MKAPSYNFVQKAMAHGVGHLRRQQRLRRRNRDKIKAAITANTEGKVTVTSVAKSPVPGIYEIVSGQEIFYSDSTGQYAFVDGRLMDLKNAYGYHGAASRQVEFD